MLNFTKTVNRLVIKAAQQIDTKLMRPSEKFLENLLVRFCFMKSFGFVINELKLRKILILGLW